MQYDVAIVGGGPGGSTTGSLLKKYRRDLRVLILERARFPREHVGESQLPDVSKILHEMGCWDQVEAANFPIKIGATYRWGANPELWDFEFLPLREFRDEPRPARYEGQRRRTAFQVDRARYDDILLNHAAGQGCEVRQETGVEAVRCDGDRVTALELSTGETVTARHYVDASGNAAVLRRALGVPTDVPTRLKNVAFWDYWENAEWAVEIGVGGTRVQVMSLGYGWLWFIPLGPTRTSLGLVCPAEYYRQSGKSPEDLYAEAVRSEPRIAGLVANARREGRVRTTNDWSFLADRTVGANWFLVGEAAGFADPILAAGLTLTQVGAREAAYTILELERGEHDAAWLRRHLDDNQRRRVRQHIRFADFWYAANGQFTDLQEHCRQIAADAGLRLTAQEAWAWLAQGGFANDVIGQAGIGGLGLAGVKQVTRLLTGEEVTWHASDGNVFTLALDGATEEPLPTYADGRVTAVPCYHRGGQRLPLTGMYHLMVHLLRATADAATLLQHLVTILKSKLPADQVGVALSQALQALEVLVSEGWVRAELDPARPRLALATPLAGDIIHPHDAAEDRRPSPKEPDRAP